MAQLFQRNGITLLWWYLDSLSA